MGIYLDFLMKAYRPGLVQKPVQVKRGGKVFQRRQWTKTGIGPSLSELERAYSELDNETSKMLSESKERGKPYKSSDYNERVDRMDMLAERIKRITGKWPK